MKSFHQNINHFLSSFRALKKLNFKNDCSQNGVQRMGHLVRVGITCIPRRQCSPIFSNKRQNNVYWNACITVKMSWFALLGFFNAVSSLFLCFGFGNHISISPFIFEKYDTATQCLMRVPLNKQLFCQLRAFCILHSR